MRHVAKGGNWSTTEDEVLKAAVMKHGLRSWGKIASLLVRKTSLQCKERWTDWLDPSLQAPSAEWSRDEDEMLLRSARSMPAQWQTIAPMVGRSAQQCAERHTFLLDAAAASVEGSGDHIPGGRQLQSRLSTGHAYAVLPESHVGGVVGQTERWGGWEVGDDSNDGDEDLLREARSRLSQTEGLRAKRRARKLLTAESSRTTTELKERELEEAGIRTKRAKRSNAVGEGASLVYQRNSQRIVRKFHHGGDPQT